MDAKGNKLLISAARQLRKNGTAEERHLWYDYLSKYPVKFTRQKILGRFIADFYCAQAKLVIELDGSQHYTEAGMERDTERTAYLNAYSIEVLRIPNNEVNQNFSGVCAYIDMIVNQRISSL